MKHTEAANDISFWGSHCRPSLSAYLPQNKVKNDKKKNG
jgi:hypothetical protein